MNDDMTMTVVKKNIKKECDICGENINKSTRKEVTCPFDDKCGESCCSQCFNRVLLTSGLTPTCMWCRKDLSLEFIDTNTTAKFYGEYMDYRGQIHVDIAKGRLPQLQEQADLELRGKRFKNALRERHAEIGDMTIEFLRLRHLLNDYYEQLKIPGRSNLDRGDFRLRVENCDTILRNIEDSCALCNSPAMTDNTHRTDCPRGCNVPICTKCVKLTIMISKDCFACDKKYKERTKEQLEARVTQVFAKTVLRHRKILPEREDLVKLCLDALLLIKEKLALNQKYYELCLDMYKVKHGIVFNRNAAAEQSQAVQKKPEKVFIKKCPDSNCRGFLSSAWKCGICAEFFCADCHIKKDSRKDEEHVCNEDEKATVALLKSDSKPCPQCGGLIHRYTGCSQVWTPCCKIAFDWNTGKVVSKTERIHSPEYYDYMRRVNNGVVPREIGDNPCGGLVAYHEIRNGNPELCRLYINYHQNMEHISNDTFRRLPQTLGRFETDDLGVDYLIGDIDEKKWKDELKRRIKKDEKNNNIYHVLNMYVNVLSDLFRNAIADKNLETFKTNVDSLVNYTNNQLEKINKRYKSSDKSYYLVHP